jgi:Domain of unknown function (DUF4082)
VTLGTRFNISASTTITGLRFFKPAGDTATSRTATLYGPTGAVLATATTSAEPASGWISVTLKSTAVASGKVTAAIFSPTGAYGDTPNYLTAVTATNNPKVTRDLAGGTYAYGAMSFPTSTYQNDFYFVDLLGY